MTPRSRDEIVLTALKVERSKLVKRLERLKKIRRPDPDPTNELMAVYQEFKGIDIRTPQGEAKLAELAKREKAALAAIERASKRDFSRDIEEEVALEFEIREIDNELFFRGLRAGS